MSAPAYTYSFSIRSIMWQLDNAYNHAGQKLQLTFTLNIKMGKIYESVTLTMVWLLVPEWLV